MYIFEILWKKLNTTFRADSGEKLFKSIDVPERDSVSIFSFNSDDGDEVVLRNVCWSGKPDAAVSPRDFFFAVSIGD